jgi:UDP-2,4-diacetamido-2,4,6-trideoxy-beta-L-altropyranose hydrolase
MSRRSLVVRADATPEVGAGHLMRCITLAEAWAAEGFGPSMIWGTVSIPFVEARLRECRIPLLESSPTNLSSVMIVDSYDDDVRRSTHIAPAQIRVLVDDLGDTAGGYDVIWNPNAYSADSLYPGFEGTVLSGERAVPIRSGLPRWKAESSMVAVTLGGTRPPNWLIEGLRLWSVSLSEIPLTGESSWCPSEWRSVRADEFWPAFAKSSMLLTSAGTTVWEAANVGIPVCVIVTAPNQQLIAQWAAEHGVPVVDALRLRDPAAIAAAVRAAAPRARALPHLDSGARFVARKVSQLV